MSKIHDLIANADDKTMVDFRRGSQIDSVPIEDLRPLAKLWLMRDEILGCLDQDERPDLSAELEERIRAL